MTVTPRRAFLLALAAFFLLGSAWAMALPPNGTYDERHHIVKAYAVADGQILPSGPDRQSFSVPSSLSPANPDCLWQPRDHPNSASCQVASPAGSGARVATATYAGRYNPVYYLPVGLPLTIWPNQTGIILARMVSALLSALLLAAAVWVAAWLGNWLLVAAVALVTTPMVVNLAAAINPNGIEISAAVLLFVSLLALISSAQAGPSRAAPARSGLSRSALSRSGLSRSALSRSALSRSALLTLAGIGAFLLLTVRAFGPVLLAVDVVAVAALGGAGFVRSEVRRRDTWVLLGGWVMAGLAVAIAWTIAVRSPVGPGPGSPTDLTAGDVVRGLLGHRIEFYVRQIVGQFGYGETTISPLAILLWYAVVAALVLPALWRAGWRVRLVVVGLIMAGFAMLIGLEFYFIPSQGWFSHGRYAMPILVGAVLIAAWASPADRPRPWWLPVALVAATAPVHPYALVRVMSRYQVGIESSLRPFDGSWHPSVGSAVPLITLMVGAGLLIAAVWSGRIAPADGDKDVQAPHSTRTVSAN